MTSNIEEKYELHEFDEAITEIYMYNCTSVMTVIINILGLLSELLLVYDV